MVVADMAVIDQNPNNSQIEGKIMKKKQKRKRDKIKKKPIDNAHE